MSTRIIHLSDLHVGKTDHESANLARIVDWIIREFGDHSNKPVILITGDIAQDGEEDQFLTAKGLLKPLYDRGMVVWPVPGNHDYGTYGIHAERRRFADFKGVFFSPDVPEFGGENISYPYNKKLHGHPHHFVALNSMKGELRWSESLWADGELGAKQLQDTLGFLKTVKERDRQKEKVIMFLHHHPFKLPRGVGPTVYDIYEHLFLRLDDGVELMQKIADQVDILLFGHEHHHLDFSGTEVCLKYKIPLILSAGKSTDDSSWSIEHKVREDGDLDKDTVVTPAGLLGRVIEILDDGTINAETVTFS